jgi:O-antigen/teichoic acid export membrane protein
MALYSVVMYLGNLDFGVTAAAINAATMAYARKDWDTFKRVQGTAWATSLLIAGIGSVLVIALSLFYFHVNRWLGLTVINQRDARLVFCGLSIALLANIPGRQLIAVYTAIGKFATYQWLYNAFAIFSVVVTAVALSVGARPVALAAVLAGTTLLLIVFAAWYLGWQGSGLLPRIRDADWRTAKMLAAPTGQFGISMIATALTIQGPIVILSRALGGPAVALFTTTRTVANVVRGTLTLLRAPLRPEFSAASAQSSRDALRRLFRIAVSIDATIAICLTAVLWSGGVWLIRFWSRGRIHPDPMLLHLLLVAFLLEGFLQILAIAGWATNRFQAWSLGQLAAAVISLMLAIALLGRFGPSAIPIAAIVPLIAIMTPLSVRNACNEAHLTVRSVAGRFLLPFALLVAFSAAFPTWLASLSIAPAWLGGIISSSAICAVAVFTGAAVFLTRSDRTALRNRLLIRFSRRTH